MKKIFVAIILISVLLVLAGCKGKIGTGTSGTGIKTEDFHQGTEGLTMEFLDNAPPKKIYDDTELIIVAELRNEGAFPIESPYNDIYLSGYDTSIISVVPTFYSDIELDPKDRFNPEGGYDTREFRSSSINMPDGTDVYKPTFMLTSCYKYRTEASIPICVDPDPYSIKTEEKVCEIKDVSDSGGQGAPVVIEKVEETVLSNEVQFKIFLKNAGEVKGGKAKKGTTATGRGKVVKMASFSRCPFNLEYNDLDEVDIVDVILGADNHYTECKPDPIRLFNGEAIVFCRFNKPTAGTAFMTNLQIVLEYGFSSSISQEVEIIKVPE